MEEISIVFPGFPVSPAFPMLIKYSYFVFDNRQIFITSNELEVMKHFLQIRSSIENGKRTSKYLEKYVALNYPEALYLKATQWRRSEKEHFEGVKKAASLNYPTALYWYGAYVDMGDYCSINKTLASECFKKAAHLGHAQSEWIYGVECFYGLGEQPLDRELGLEFMERSARKKYGQALSFFEEQYRSGKFLEKNERKAEFFRAQLRDSDIIDLE